MSPCMQDWQSDYDGEFKDAPTVEPAGYGEF
jgi:hypothetical protein